MIRGSGGIVISAVVLVLALLLAYPFSMHALAGEEAQIIITMGDDPHTSMNISWNTEANLSFVRYGLTRQLELGVVEGEVIEEPFADGFRAKATLSGLSPGTTYYYQVSLDVDRWSEVYRFRTAPDEPVDFTFIAYGDQSRSKQARKIVDVARSLEPSFVLHLGDLAYLCEPRRSPDCDRLRQNRQLMDWLWLISPLSSIAPYMVAWGNHEYPEQQAHPEDFMLRIPLPGNGRWYSFDYGNVHFIALNTEEPWNTSSEQYRWLRSDLAKSANRTDIAWRIVYLHKHLYASKTSVISATTSNPNRAKLWHDLFLRYGVDLVLQAHVHAYERTWPIINSSSVVRQEDRHLFKEPGAPIYVTSGGAGASLFRFTTDPERWSLYRASEYHFLKVSVFKNGTLTLQAISLNGTVLDYFKIIKDLPQDIGKPDEDEEEEVAEMTQALIERTTPTEERGELEEPVEAMTTTETTPRETRAPMNGAAVIDDRVGVERLLQGSLTFIVMLNAVLIAALLVFLFVRTAKRGAKVSQAGGDIGRLSDGGAVWASGG